VLPHPLPALDRVWISAPSRLGWPRCWPPFLGRSLWRFGHSSRLWIALGLTLPHVLVECCSLVLILWLLCGALGFRVSLGSRVDLDPRLGRVLQFGLDSLATLWSALGFRVGFGSRLDLDKRSLTPWYGAAVWPQCFGCSLLRVGHLSWQRSVTPLRGDPVRP
jgi:hypothetical protein